MNRTSFRRIAFGALLLAAGRHSDPVLGTGCVPRCRNRRRFLYRWDEADPNEDI